ncbi:MAG: RagB/SusD family nutrient uptake outer membrane protein [Bacteroidales bacterium]|nr:RagB/SusD family nutrient uptake outer membrane protein [Bacteroidales bacterium]MBN2699092.1 RagB/SusD family nutrient uptake outer membrane protein [Bacteroidales bacterium]
MKSKKTNLKIVLFLISLMVVSCQEMEMEKDLGVDDKLLWSNPGYINSYMVDLISMMPNGFSPDELGQGIFYANATDEAENSNPSAQVQDFNTGNIDPTSEMVNQVWNKYYNGIYKVNLFLHKTDTLNLDHYVPEQRDLYLKSIEKYRSEARFLRALFYYELIKRFGGVVLLGDTYIAEYKDISQVSFTSARSSFAECADYIINECDDLLDIGGLPLSEAEAQGRPNLIAIMTLKCKTLGFKASTSYNTAIQEGSTEQREIWTQVVVLAKEIVNMKPIILGPYNTYNGTGSEVILGYRLQYINFLERINYPIGCEGVYTTGSTNPTQKLVDAFRMQNGMKIDEPGSGYDPENPYQNRDSRLLLTVIPNGTQWYERNVVPREIEVFAGGRDGMDRYCGTRTGYYLRKYINPSLDLRQNYGENRVWPIFRYADVHLLWAEGLNELFGPQETGGTGNSATAILNRLITQSAGLPRLNSSDYTQESMRERIREESFIELAFENHRAWNLRRWGIATEVLNSPVYRMKVTKDADGYIHYEKEKLEERYFDERMMLYPIPQRAVNNGLEQNPYW